MSEKKLNHIRRLSVRKLSSMDNIVLRTFEFGLVVEIVCITDPLIAKQSSSLLDPLHTPFQDPTPGIQLRVLEP